MGLKPGWFGHKPDELLVHLLFTAPFHKVIKITQNTFLYMISPYRSNIPILFKVKYPIFLFDNFNEISLAYENDIHLMYAT